MRKVYIEFDLDNDALQDDSEHTELQRVLLSCVKKIQLQNEREPGCVCTAPESIDQLRDINGNLIGSVEVKTIPDVKDPKATDAMVVGLEHLLRMVRGQDKPNPLFMAHFLYVLLKIGIQWGRDYIDEQTKHIINNPPHLFIPSSYAGEAALDRVAAAHDPMIHAVQRIFRVLDEDKWFSCHKMMEVDDARIREVMEISKEVAEELGYIKEKKDA